MSAHRAIPQDARACGRDAEPVTGLAFDRSALARLSAGHLCTDMCQGAIPALFPFLITQRGLSFGQTSGLLVVMTVCSSVLQPLFGLFADRTSASFFLPLGLVLAGGGIALTGMTSDYTLQLAAVAVGGLGVGIFHPDAARRARVASGARVTTGFSYFSVGGNAGFAIAPALITPAVLLVGLEGSAIVLPLCLAAAIVLALHPPPLQRESQKGNLPPHGADNWSAFARVGSIAGLRSGVYFGLQAFLAGYFIQHFGASDGAANAALTAMLAAGAVGTLAGGRLADHIDPRAVLAGSMVLQPVLLALLLAVDGEAAGIAVAALLGFVTVGTFSVTVVLGQTYLPSRPGLASGVTLGLAIGVGGLIAALLGPVADVHGTRTVLWILAILPLPATALAVSLPRIASALPSRRDRGDAVAAGS